jgi:cytochrome c551/c552
MGKMERFSFVALVAGILFFLFADFISWALPMFVLKDIPKKSVQDLVAEAIAKNTTAWSDFKKLAMYYPESFQKLCEYTEKFSGATEVIKDCKPNEKTFAKALKIGHRWYVAEGCWNCHSQMIRPVSNETLRFGIPGVSNTVSYPSEYNNELQAPVLWGTKRVGPDLIREAAVHNIGWQAAHLYNPLYTSPGSNMPGYPWYFTKDKNGNIVPNERGISLLAYVMWLGSWEVKPPKEFRIEAKAVETATPGATEAETAQEEKPQTQEKVAVATESKPAEKKEEASSPNGQQLFQSKGCAACHQASADTVGPSLKKIAGAYAGKKDQLVKFLKGEHDAIVDPAKFGIMQPQLATTKAMSEQELNALVDFILSHK